MRLSLYIGNNKIDLFEDESIELKSSVQDVNDITKNTTDFTKNFKVPASSNNNIAFKHYYDASIDNTFDARTKVDARLELDNIVFRYGKASLLSVDVKFGKPSAYSLVFYGNLVNLKDKVKDDYLNVIDLSAYDHEFNSTNVKTGLTSSLFSGSIVYPLMAKKRYYYDSANSDHTDTDTITNIAYHTSHGNVHGVRFSELKPSIKLIRVIEAIETKYDIEFSRDFFGKNEFDKIYMWLNTDTSKSIETFSEKINWDGGDSTYVNLTTDIGYFNTFRATQVAFKKWQHDVRITPDDDTVPYTLKIYLNGTLFYETSNTGESVTGVSSSNLGYVGAVFNEDYNLYYEIEAPANFIYFARWANTPETQTGTSASFITTASTSIITNDFIVSPNLPRIKVIDFLKGLFQMFKLVVVQKNPRAPIYVNTLIDYYSEGVIYDLTNYIDSSSHTVERGKLLNQITYEFKEPKTILNEQFELNTGLGYGDEQSILETEDGETLDGSSLEITLPFEQVVYERLTDQQNGVITNIQYGAIINTELEAVNISPHLHYSVNINIGSDNVSFLDEDNNSSSLGVLNIPSHTITLNEPQHSLIFGSELSTFNQELITNTIYKRYHSDFISSIFNIKRRTFKYTAYNLPYRYLMSLDLNDVIKIKEEYYRINSFSPNLLTGKVSFELINSFDNTLNPFNTNDTIILASAEASREYAYVTNAGKMSVALTDLGDGKDWLSVSVNDNAVVIDFDANLSGSAREAMINVLNEDKTKEILIIARQLE